MLSISKNQLIGQTERLRFPWILWHLWKARNSFFFEQKRISPENIFSKAVEDSSIWFKLLQIDQEEKSDTSGKSSDQLWRKPSLGFIKCNVCRSWSARHHHSGGSWVSRDFRGQTLEHSRRSFIGLKSGIEADLEIICWAANDLKTLYWNRVIIETSSLQVLDVLQNPASFPLLADSIRRTRQALHSFQNCSIEVVSASANRVAEKIADSVTRDGRLSSYIARGGPRWLFDDLLADAANPSLPLPR